MAWNRIPHYFIDDLTKPSLTYYISFNYVDVGTYYSLNFKTGLANIIRLVWYLVIRENHTRSKKIPSTVTISTNGKDIKRIYATVTS